VLEGLVGGWRNISITLTDYGFLHSRGPSEISIPLAWGKFLDGSCEGCPVVRSGDAPGHYGILRAQSKTPQTRFESWDVC